MPALDVYFDTERLAQAVGPLLQIIPSFFRLTVRPGTPEIAYYWPKDPNWSDFPFPVREGNLYIFCGDGLASRYAGGAFRLRAAVKVMSRELRDPDLVGLRIWHELLHAVGQPADDMIPLASRWLPPEGYEAFSAQRRGKKSVDTNYWQQQFYHWLTMRAIEEGMRPKRGAMRPGRDARK